MSQISIIMRSCDFRSLPNPEFPTSEVSFDWSLFLLHHPVCHLSLSLSKAWGPVLLYQSATAGGTLLSHYLFLSSHFWSFWSPFMPCFLPIFHLCSIWSFSELFRILIFTQSFVPFEVLRLIWLHFYFPCTFTGHNCPLVFGLRRKTLDCFSE